ncbi:MAG TPA: hypothetical protein VKE88_03070 [Candidatus Nanoarchaeia archaeon]|nr:hypothetical protein [Candidatus Nanoarchaeia archaeon]
MTLSNVIQELKAEKNQLSSASNRKNSTVLKEKVKQLDEVIKKLEEIERDAKESEDREEIEIFNKKHSTANFLKVFFEVASIAMMIASVSFATNKLFNLTLAYFLLLASNAISFFYKLD